MNSPLFARLLSATGPIQGAILAVLCALTFDWCALQLIWEVDGPNGVFAQYAWGVYPGGENVKAMVVASCVAALIAMFQGLIIGQVIQLCRESQFQVARDRCLSWGGGGVILIGSMLKSGVPGEFRNLGMTKHAPFDPIVFAAFLPCFGLSVAFLFAALSMRVARKP